jgi:adenosylmethionine-8-amino-7-oxononanoate aminotransferase
MRLCWSVPDAGRIELAKYGSGGCRRSLDSLPPRNFLEIPLQKMTPASIAHWHGFTQMADFDPLVIESAQGCWLTTTDQRRLFDGVSSLWCNVHGHRHPKIDAAIAHQLKRVAHVTTLGMSADVTDALAEKLAEITPGDLSHVFFSSDGSSSVEAAMKMAFQYWQQRSDPHPEKTKFLALGSAYHGDTTGSVSLGGIKYFHQLFAPILFEPIRGPIPCSYRLPDGVTAQEAVDHYAGEIESLLRQHHRSLAAIVMEPLVQGAAGMITHPQGLLSRIRTACDRYDVLLICDEVAVGFGRTGKLFACEHESVVPDILCMGKGLTAGYLPMAATVARPHIYETFLADASAMKQFFHGHTFGGNPLAAAAALASIELLETSDILQQVDSKAAYLRDRLEPLSDHPYVGDIRGRGLMVGIEMVAEKSTGTPFDGNELVGRKICDAALERGLWIRPLTDVVVAMPPLCCTLQELDFLADTIIASIEQVFSTTMANH